MYPRLINIPKKQDFFLFGPRSTGKTTLLNQHFGGTDAFWVNLLDSEQVVRFEDRPGAFKETLESLPSVVHTVVIDEIQRVPKLLDVVQHFIQQARFHFVLTGSSARKLKRGQANLLGGRAIVRELWPLSFLEVPESEFSLDSVLKTGLLPKVFCSSGVHQIELLRSYISTYIAEEVVAEQLVRNLSPFRKFLTVAGQMNGKIINASNIGNDIDVDNKTVANYFEILQDTLLGFYLPAYHTSARKRLKKHPKFFIFDNGVANAMTRMLDVPLYPETSYYGNVFENFIITEISKLKSYFKPDWELFYLSTKDEAEVDLVIDRPGLKPLLIEIKSTENIDKIDLRSSLSLIEDFGECDSFVFSNDKISRKKNRTWCLHWKKGIAEIFGQVPNRELTKS